MNEEVVAVPEVVDEVLQHIHHLGRHIVEGDGVVTHSTKALVLVVVGGGGGGCLVDQWWWLFGGSGVIEYGRLWWLVIGEW